MKKTKKKGNMHSNYRDLVIIFIISEILALCGIIDAYTSVTNNLKSFVMFAVFIEMIALIMGIPALVVRLIDKDITYRD